MMPKRGCPDCEAAVEFYGSRATACELCRSEVIDCLGEIIEVAKKVTVNAHGKRKAWALGYDGRVYRTNSRSRWVPHLGAFPQSLKGE